MKTTVALMFFVTLLLFLPRNMLAACDPFVSPPDTKPSTVVQYAFCVVLNRVAEPGGRLYWEGKLKEGASPLDIVFRIFHSDEIQKNTGVAAMADPQWVDFLYERLLRREPEPDGHEFWVNQLKKGRSRDEVVHLWVYDGQEFRAKYPIFFKKMDLPRPDCCEVTFPCSEPAQGGSGYCQALSCPCPYASMNYTSVRGLSKNLSNTEKKKIEPITLPPVDKLDK